jgi:Sulfotransferase family
LKPWRPVHTSADRDDESVTDVDDILGDGEERSGREADRRQPWVSALRLLTSSADAEGGLSVAGTTAFTSKLRDLVAERLRAEGMLADNSEIKARPLDVRFAVAGMGRSGTTLLHRLLSCDPDVAFLPTWQAMQPVPGGRSRGDHGDDPRRSRVVRYIDELARSNPESLRIHPLDADAPEEEVFLLQHSFASMLFSLSCPLPEYNRWLVEADHTDAYHFAFDLLRLNEWAAGDPAGRPRVMKSPQFLLDLEVVLEVAPEAVVAQTHRDPVDLVGSYCSTYASSRRRSVSALDLAALGRERLTFLGTMADRAVSVRDAASPDRFVDVHYSELVRQPFQVLQRLYDAAGVPLAPTARSRMRRWLETHPQHQAGRHEYDLADYALNRDIVEARFSAYLERFGVARDVDAV